MKKLILLSMAICTLSVSAGEYTHSLTGENAKKMFKILNSAGIPSTKFGTKTTLEAYDVFCIGQNYQNVCYVSTEGSDPASSRLDIYGDTTGKLWGLLKQAGFKNFISELSDGSAGKTVIEAGNIACTLNNNFQNTESLCLFN